MVFQNPHILIGLAAMLLPLVLHFLNRARYRNVDWGAMMFLDGNDGQNTQSARLKQYGLLLLRSLMIGTLALALARPVVHLQGRPAMQPGRTAAVILLDRSASMSLNDNGRVRMDMAREAVFQLLSPGFRRGDDLWLVPLGLIGGGHDIDSSLGGRSEVFKFASDPQDMARLVKEVTTPAGQSDVASGILLGLQLLATSEAPNRELYIVTDKQAGSWNGIDERFIRRFDELKSKLPHPPRIIVMPIGSDLTENIYVESITPRREPLVKDRAVDVEIKVRNNSSVPRAVVSLVIEVQSPNGSVKVMRRTSIDLPALATAAVAAPIIFTDAGSHVITAKIEAPGLVNDKVLNLAVDVLADFKVLIVDGDEQEAGSQSGADFIRLAASTFGKNSRKNLAETTLVRPDGWNPADISEYQVLILSNITALSEAESDAIERFVYDGGGLLIAPGDQSRSEPLSASLRWLSARLTATAPDSDAAVTQVAELDISHPVFRFMDQQTMGNLPLVRRYFPMAINNPGGVGGMSVVARYTDGNPFLIESRLGNGRVLILTSPVDPEWNSLPLSGIFPSFVKGVLSYLGSASTSLRSARSNVFTGQSAVIEMDEPVDPATMAVLGPTGKMDANSISLNSQSLRQSVVFRNTSFPGIYRILPRGVVNARSAQFVVRTPAFESDLTPLAASRWKEFETMLGIERINPELHGTSLAQEQSRSGFELWWPLMAVSMVLAVLELVFCRYWARGRE